MGPFKRSAVSFGMSDTLPTQRQKEQRSNITAQRYKRWHHDERRAWLRGGTETRTLTGQAPDERSYGSRHSSDPTCCTRSEQRVAALLLRRSPKSPHPSPQLGLRAQDVALRE